MAFGIEECQKSFDCLVQKRFCTAVGFGFAKQNKINMFNITIYDVSQTSVIAYSKFHTQM